MYPKNKKYNLIILFFSFIFIFSFSSHAETSVTPESNTKSEFPSMLPLPNQQNTSMLESNTPEYVVIRPSDQATFSSETAASIENIYVKEGSRFNKGDTLLTMDCRLQKAELKKAAAQQVSAKKASTAAKKLKSYGSISEFEVVKATSDEQIADAEVDKLQAIVEKCIIKAPFNGSVADVMVHMHESVKQGDPLLKIVNIDNLEFELLVPSCWLKWLHVGSEFNVNINETSQVISAKITKISPEIEPVSQSVRLIATITPPRSDLLPGMSGQAKFPDVLSHNCSQSKK